MSDLNNQNEKGFSKPYKIENGKPEEIDLLPKDLGMPKKIIEENDSLIKLGDLEFNYDYTRKSVGNGSAKLRLVKDLAGKIIGFTVLTPGNSDHIINMLWVDPQYRKGGLGGILLKDAIDILPEGVISGDIWGGEPMINLAKKLGFYQNPGGSMTNRFSYMKQHIGK